MRLVVVGADGRMGRMLIRAVAQAEGCTLSAAIERDGSPALGQDAEQAPQGHGRPFGACPRSNAGAQGTPPSGGAEPEPMVSPLCRNKGGRRKGGTGRTSPYR